MAKYAPYSIFLDNENPPHHVNVKGFMEHFSEPVRWINDPARPGLYAFVASRQVSSFYISDPDVALEFKMRWYGESV